MDSRDGMKQYDDPFYATIFDSRKAGKKSAAVEKKAAGSGGRGSSGPGWPLLLTLAVLATGLVWLTYSLVEAGRRIEDLTVTLYDSRSELDGVSRQLQESEVKIGGLAEGLEQSRSQLGTQRREIHQYRELYTGLKSEQEQQVRELQAIAVEKADHGEVALLQEETGELKTRLVQVNSNLSDLRDLSTRNRSDLETTREELSEVRSLTEETSRRVLVVEQSLETEAYPFELRRGGGVMKVFEVAMSLRGTNVGRGQFDLDVLVGPQRIRKRGQPVNEPIFFYVQGAEKPYQIHVTRVDRNFVVGQLVVPSN